MLECKYANAALLTYLLSGKSHAMLNCEFISVVYARWHLWKNDYEQLDTATINQLQAQLQPCLCSAALVPRQKKFLVEALVMPEWGPRYNLIIFSVKGWDPNSLILRMSAGTFVPPSIGPEVNINSISRRAINLYLLNHEMEISNQLCLNLRRLEWEQPSGKWW